MYKQFCGQTLVGAAVIRELLVFGFKTKTPRALLASYGVLICFQEYQT